MRRLRTGRDFLTTTTAIILVFCVILAANSSATAFVVVSPHSYYRQHGRTDHRSVILPQVWAVPNHNDGHVDSDVIVVGGGLTGLATAVALQNQLWGCRVTVYEQAQAWRKIGAALGLYPNGLAALYYIDPAIYDRIQQTARPGQRFERRDVLDRVLQITEVPEIQATAPIMYAWYLLQQALKDAFIASTPSSTTTTAAAANSTSSHLKLGHSFRSYEILDNGLIRVEFEILESPNDNDNNNNHHNHRTKRITTKTCRLLVGADGIQSRVRDQYLEDPRRSRQPRAQRHSKETIRITEKSCTGPY